MWLCLLWSALLPSAALYCVLVPCSQLWAFPEASEESSLWFPSGEQLLCEASTVLKYVQEDSCQRGVYGRLVCTDFKISFLGDDDSALDNGGVRMSCVCRVVGKVQP